MANVDGSNSARAGSVRRLRTAGLVVGGVLVGAALAGSKYSEVL
jgi:hypothetical protein